MIRKLEGSDRSPVMDLLRATGNFTAPELDIAAELIEIGLTRPDQGDYYAFVDATGNRVCGLLVLGPVPATAGTWHMYWIAVHPEFHGTGTAQSLDQWAASFARGRRAYWLLAETSGQPAYQRARSFYAKQGYSVLARIPDYYKPSDDLIVFGKRLS